MVIRNGYFIASVVLIVFAFVNFARAAMQVPFFIGAVEIPLSVSWVASILSAVASLVGFFAADHR